VAVCVEPDHWLEERRRDLEHERDHPDLGVAELKGVLQQRVKRGKEGLDRVVQKVRERDRQQDGSHGPGLRGPDGRGAVLAHFVIPRLCGSIGPGTATRPAVSPRLRHAVTSWPADVSTLRGTLCLAKG
jgi:hypothetical protein